MKILFAAIVVIMFIPLLNEYFHFFKTAPLQGAYNPAKKPQIGLKQWFSGDVQDSLNIYYNESNELRPFFVRVNNQIDFSLFRKTKASKIVIGKEGYLFEDNYLKAWQGSDFIGEQRIDSLVIAAATAQKVLREVGVDMLLVLAPGKATFFPEFIPSPFNKRLPNPTNYELISKKCVEAGINCIDMNKWFVEMKDTASFPLYPKCGIHWSYYGMFLAADSIIKKIEAMRNIDMPEMYITKMEKDQKQRDTDYDIGHTLNLMFPIETYPMSYPVIGYQNQNKNKPDALVIGDSYYWNIYFSGIPSVMFKNLDFWYYNSSIFNDGTNVATGSTDNINYAGEIKKRDVIVVLQTDGGLNNFGFGFFNRVINELQGGDFESRIEYYKKAILNDPAWKKQVEDKARTRGISFEEMLYLDAKYMVLN